MSKSRTITVLVRLAFFGGTLALAPIMQAQAQIDFSVLDKYRGLDAQKGTVARTESNADSPKTERPREPTAKEMQKAREQAARLVATIRQKLSNPGPASSVTWGKTTVNVGASVGYLNTPPSPAGVFAAVAAGAAKTRATTMTSLALRRTGSILAAAIRKDSKGNAESPETAAFLADEAANSMAGGDLRVRVDDTAVKWNARLEQEFRAVLQEAEEGYRDIEFAKSEQARVDKEVVSIVKAVKEGTLSSEKAENNIKALSDTLETAFKRSKEAQKKIHELPKKMETIVQVQQ